MKRILVIGGANGIGLSIAKSMAGRKDCEIVYVVDKVELADEYKEDKIKSFVFDLASDDYSFFDRFTDIDSLMITAAFSSKRM